MPNPETEKEVCSRCHEPLLPGSEHRFHFEGAVVCERCAIPLAAKTFASLAGLADLPLK